MRGFLTRREIKYKRQPLAILFVSLYNISYLYFLIYNKSVHKRRITSNRGDKQTFVNNNLYLLFNYF